ncbi:MAG: M55 family metallopeptidase [Kiritimatiellae bacterium]|nr:M55 family metallopeptidase [Kiritimatiellia bacterium]
MKAVEDLKLAVESDMEGVSGAVYGGYGMPPSKEGERSERLMTREVNALVEGARDAGLRDITIFESHRLDKDLLIDGVTVVSGVQDVGAYDLLAFTGRHARAGVGHAVLAHTGSSRSVASMRVNGVAFGEFGVTAALAGHYGVPTVFLSGDRAACDEASDLIPNITTVCVEDGLGSHTAICLAPRKAQQKIREGMKRAIENRAEVNPFEVQCPVTVEYEVFYPGLAQRFTLVPGVRMKDDRTISYTCADYEEAHRMYRATSLALVWWDVRGRIVV